MAALATLGSLWEQAACQTADPELFFPVAAAGASLTQIARAKAVCAACPVREQCLDYAVETGQAHGVWGGTTVDERHVIAARRRRELARSQVAGGTPTLSTSMVRSSASTPSQKSSTALRMSDTMSAARRPAS